MPWCRFFIPKIASPNVKPGDPDLNEYIAYAKCVKGHVLRDASGWVQCENLPAPDAKCWQEGGETLFTLTVRRRNEDKEASQNVQSQEGPKTHSSKS
ncbi:hypothetical protein KDW_00350 [Dictyobacter vulcani]|uniref:Uncharacterized protein n=1 Tax=Dictyobacter vulcani TaxID=2607529 RepID=A0A5J4KEG6_9CHLR|nr:hypothetical protein KDW_00350 [Dictyobacter vulcani]